MIARIIITVLIILNGFFVLSEFSLIKIRMSQVELLIQHGHKKAKLIKTMIDNIDEYLAASQLGITIASLLLGGVGEPLVGKQLITLLSFLGLPLPESVIHIISIILLFLIITILQVVIGEQAPKIVAINNPMHYVKLISYPLHWFYIIFKPLNRFISLLTNLTLKALGLHTIDNSDHHTEEELRMIVAESKEEGVINVTEEALIQKVFDYDDKQVGEIMTPINKIFAINKDNRSSNILHSIIDEGYSRIPIFENSKNNMIGRVLLKDIIALHLTNKDVILDSVLRPLLFVPETMKINTCLTLLQKKHTHIAIVVSEYGNTMGLISMEDILEELVGEINDENDEEVDLIKELQPGKLLVDTTASIQDINEVLPLPLPEHDEYETVSGYLHLLYGRIPQIGDVFTTKNYKITIKKKQNQRIIQALFEIISDIKQNNQKFDK